MWYLVIGILATFALGLSIGSLVTFDVVNANAQPHPTEDIRCGDHMQP